MIGVPAGRINQYRLVGEPPVAIGRALRRLQRDRIHLVCFRELESGIQSGNGLARLRRAQHQEPRQIVKLAVTLKKSLQAQPAPMNASDMLDSLADNGAKHVQFFPWPSSRVIGRREDALDEGIVAAQRAPQTPGTVYPVGNDDQENADGTRSIGSQWTNFAERKERAEMPQQHTHRGYRERAIRPAPQPANVQHDQHHDGGHA
ncbi:hypothetical protein D3C71_1619520 [compost metagenome]